MKHQKSRAAKKILALCSVYNRVKITLPGLKSLETALNLSGCDYDICIVDDGSVDGTVDVIQSNLVKAKILRLSGGQFWARSMRQGFNRFWDSKQYFAILVFNDDCLFKNNSITNLISKYDEVVLGGHSDLILVGPTSDETEKNITYGGWVRRSNLFWLGLQIKKIQAGGVEADTLNMNCALISGSVVDRYGFIDEEFIHGMADFDYGLRMTKKGVLLLVLGEYVAVCPHNSTKGSWVDNSVGLIDRFKNINNVKVLPVSQTIFFMRRHAGLLWPLFVLYPYIKASVNWGYHKIIGAK